MQHTIYIDEVRPCTLIDDSSDKFEIEWFETKKHLFQRATVSGTELYLLKENDKEWCNGDQLFSKGEFVARLVIKPTLVIQFTSHNSIDVADFSFFIGNRHLPIYLAGNNVFVVPYDGKLYEQLLPKFTTQVELVKKQLFSSDLLKKKIIY